MRPNRIQIAYGAMGGVGALLAGLWLCILVPRELLVEGPMIEAEERMDEVATAIRAFYRAEGRTPGLVYIRQRAMQGATREERVWLMRQRFKILGSDLTTPTPYLAAIPLDPFSPRRSHPFSVERIGSYWIVQSPGPDSDYDIKSISSLILYGAQQQAKRLQGQRSPQALSPNRESLFDPGPALLPHTYDPTNGAFSSGDIFKSGRFEEPTSRREGKDTQGEERNDRAADPATRIGA